MIKISEKRSRLPRIIKSLLENCQWITGIQKAVSMKHALLTVGNKADISSRGNAAPGHQKIRIVSDDSPDASGISGIGKSLSREQR